MPSQHGPPRLEREGNRCSLNSGLSTDRKPSFSFSQHSQGRAGFSKPFLQKKLENHHSNPTHICTLLEKEMTKGQKRKEQIKHIYFLYSWDNIFSTSNLCAQTRHIPSFRSLFVSSNFDTRPHKKPIKKLERHCTIQSNKKVMLRGHRMVWCLTIWPLVASGLSSCSQLQHPLAVCLGQSAFIPCPSAKWEW